MMCIASRLVLIVALILAHTLSGALPASAQTDEDYTYMRGLEIREMATQLTGESLRAAFADNTHHGTYILNRDNKVTATYSETHHADGRVRYVDERGESSGQWITGAGLICYKYDAASTMSGGCFAIYAMDECYYFFSGGTLYDGYSIISDANYDSLPQCIPLIG